MCNPVEAKVEVTKKEEIHVEEEKKEKKDGIPGPDPEEAEGLIEEEKKTVWFMPDEGVKPATQSIPLEDDKPEFKEEEKLSRHELKQKEKEQKKKEKEEAKEAKKAKKAKEAEEKKGIKVLEFKRIEATKDEKEEKSKEQLNQGAFFSRYLQRANSPEYAGDKTIEHLLDCMGQFEQIYNTTTLPTRCERREDFVERFLSMRKSMQLGLDELGKSMEEVAAILSQKENAKTDPLLSLLLSEVVRVEEIKKDLIIIQDKILNLVDTKPDDVPYGKSIDEVLTDKKLMIFFEEKELTERNSAGVGGINSVYMVKEPVSGKTRIMKEGKLVFSTEEAKKRGFAGDNEMMTLESVFGKNLHTDEAITIEARLSYRDVAVSMVDKIFGLDAVVETSLARSDEGKMSSLMDKADGSSADRTYIYWKSHEEAITRLMAQQKVYYDVARQSISGKTEEEAIESAREEYKKLQFIDLSVCDEAFESAMNMAALDIIVGHVDRHRGNYFVNSRGKITGIDNDTAFRLTHNVFESSAELELTEEEKDVSGEVEAWLKNVGKHDEKTLEKMKKAFVDSRLSAKQQRKLIEKRSVEIDGSVINIQNDKAPVLYFDKAFPCITRELRDKILGVSEETLRAGLMGMLDDDAIEACVARTKKFKEYLRSMPPDKVLDDISQMTDKDKQDYFYDKAAMEKSISFNYLTTILKDREGKMRPFFDSQEVSVLEKKVIEAGGSDLMPFVDRCYRIKNIQDKLKVITRLTLRLIEEIEKNPQFDIMECFKKKSKKETNGDENMKDMIREIIEGMEGIEATEI